jgi:hypothetical protein
MARRPFSESDIEFLKSYPYINPEPPNKFVILLLILIWPVGLFYLFYIYTPSVILSLCKTEEKREKYLTYLRSSPNLNEINKANEVLRKHHLSRALGIPSLGIPAYWYLRKY